MVAASFESGDGNSALVTAFIFVLVFYAYCSVLHIILPATLCYGYVVDPETVRRAF